MSKQQRALLSFEFSALIFVSCLDFRISNFPRVSAPPRLCVKLFRMTKPTTTFPVIAGKKTQLTIGGEGPPLFYLHSASGETEWMPFHELLAKHFTVYLPAHPGFADSKGLEEVRDIYDYAWHYVDFLQEL